jgi:REP element-mobilizing transposase RayT
MQTRKRLRLRSFDYSSAGAYFVTICAVARAPRFGRLDDASITLRPLGQLVSDHLERVRSIPGVELLASVVMPDHVHTVVMLDGSGVNLTRLVGSFKASTTRESRALGCRGPIWQRGYYEHIVRADEALDGICEYVVTNPLRAALRVSDRGLGPTAG